MIYIHILKNGQKFNILDSTLEELLEGDFSHTTISQTDEQESYQAFINQLQPI